ncbi:hypothetical protein CEXT_622871 [Caerostris extrusa]|uniref:Uncharacterized protein n=1 Tax=Caerostris extrusa TaxID=172846 RepID=A0AAV4X9V2_CAEEX|nr:hypothetical protein CEXT_622871 [Caerostris extrusa]
MLPSEYASIFNSKKTSFITKQVNLNEDKAINVLPTVITDAKKHEDDIHLKDPPSPMKQTIDLNTNRISDDKLRVRHCKTNTAVTQTVGSAEKPMRKISNASCEHDSEESSHFSGIKKV